MSSRVKSMNSKRLRYVYQKMRSSNAWLVIAHFFITAKTQKGDIIKSSSVVQFI